MRIETDEGFITLIAKDDAEKAMLQPLADAINSEDTTEPAQVVDNLENGPEHRIINGSLVIQIK